MVKRTMMVMALTSAFLLPATAIAGNPDPTDGVSDKLAQKYNKQHKKALDAFGYKVVGRNIVKTGLTNKKSATRKDVIESLETIDRWFNPPTAVVETGSASYSEAATAATTGAPSTYSGGSAGGYASASTAQCESGGDPTAVSPGGQYRGKWQFDQGTWDAYAPHGYAGSDPASAPESVQDAAAGNVPYDAWPNC